MIIASPVFWVLLLAPALFAVRMSIANPLGNMLEGIRADYLAAVITLPFNFLIVLIPLVVLYRLLPARNQVFGAQRYITFGGGLYRRMLLLMIPLIIFASTQPNFLYTYP
ncbi:hypothetical protein [Nitrosomonas supralitoralis]|uniref:Uncharacterized protein n=1 Tax=Nitrosomonas supralitoralis TaxID=2116706 RepID=A0A2P7NX53_9PROT|nr:hypothetical protein [Nitrosomonas supralitoralis]PSJ18058.1 hypothetical protein C7H79_05080 [Nitrosomonas supralitoralis]